MLRNVLQSAPFEEDADIIIPGIAQGIFEIFLNLCCKGYASCTLKQHEELLELLDLMECDDMKKMLSKVADEKLSAQSPELHTEFTCAAWLRASPVPAR